MCRFPLRGLRLLYGRGDTETRRPNGGGRPSQFSSVALCQHNIYPPDCHGDSKAPPPFSLSFFFVFLVPSNSSPPQLQTLNSLQFFLFFPSSISLSLSTRKTVCLQTSSGVLCMCVCVCNKKSLGLWPGDRQSYTVDINTIIQGYTLSENRHLEDGESLFQQRVATQTKCWLSSTKIKQASRYPSFQCDGQTYKQPAPIAPRNSSLNNL